MNHEGAPRKTFPKPGHKTREARNAPEAPSVSLRTIKGLTIEVPGRIPTVNGHVRIEKVIKDGGYGREIIVFEMSPRTKEPLKPVFKNRKGGRTVGGGGTSKEALRRAKQKAKRNGNINSGK